MHDIATFLFLTSVKDHGKPRSGEHNGGYQGRDYARGHDRAHHASDDYEKPYHTSHDPYQRSGYSSSGSAYAEPYAQEKPPMYDEAVSPRYSDSRGAHRQYQY